MDDLICTLIFSYFLLLRFFPKKTYPSVSAGLDRTPLDQALAQLAALGITIAFACIVGWLTGIRLNFWN